MLCKFNKIQNELIGQLEFNNIHSKLDDYSCGCFRLAN